MKGNRYRRIEEARKILGLGEEATRNEVRDAFRELSRQYHPDSSRERDISAAREKFEQIVRAREVLEQYCDNYRYSFREEEIRRQPADGDISDHLDRFYGNNVI
ncbi:MAG: DnaJ domain-containing protein [Candidatus Erginobacter occultus]|nr:DnaJ domain-containing protein [Candidatus Erginobacter occultus]